MKFDIEPDPAHPLGGHALLILPEGASTGSGRMVFRRPRDNWHLGGDGWQAAQATLGPFPVSSHKSGHAVELGPEVVDHIDEFEALEITFEDGAKGSACWPENVLPSPTRAVPGGLHRAEGIAAEPARAGREGSAPLPAFSTDSSLGSEPESWPESPSADSPDPEPEAPAAPPSESSAGSRNGLLGALAVAAVVVIAVVVVLSTFDFDQLLGDTSRGEGTRENCSDSAFSRGQEGDPAAQIERVRHCAGVEGVSPEIRLATVERLLDRYPEARIVMGRWYDPAHREEDFSPLDEPAIENAALHYFEAKKAGVEDAEALLFDVCGRLDSNDLMQENALRLYCPAR